MLISIDHGNKQIKTVHKTFTSGLCESNTRPPFGGDVLFYNGKYYTLSDQRIPYMRDKTADERFFILTLFAIGFELRRMLPSEKRSAFSYASDCLLPITVRCIGNSSSISLIGVYSIFSLTKRNFPYISPKPSVSHRLMRRPCLSSRSSGRCPRR